MAKPSFSWLKRARDSVISLLDETVFFRSDGREATRFHHFIHFWMLVGTSFVRNRGPLRATALAYTTMLALVPMLAVGLGVSTWMLKGQGGEEAIKDFVAKIVDETAPQLGLMPGDGKGPATIAAGDIRDLPGFIAALKAETNEVERFLWQSISETNRQQLLAPGQPGTEQKNLKATTLAQVLNGIIQSGAIYDEQRFTNITLSKNTKVMLATEPEGDKLVQLNRELLEDAFPNELAKSAGANAREMVKSRIESFIARVHSGTLGVTGTIGLVVIAIGLLSNIEATFNDIWGVKQGRPWHLRVLQYWGVLTLGPMFLVLAMGLRIGGQVQKTQQVIEHSLPLIGDWVIVSMVFLAPFLISWTVFSLLYIMIPNTRVGWKSAFVGGLIACILWHVNNSLNVMFASRVVTASKIYGPLSALPVFLIGLYFSWLILLFGAQVAYTFQFRRAYLQERQAENISQRGREFVALRMATLVGERFQQGQPALTATEIADSLGVPVRLVQQVGEALVAAGFITRVASEEAAYSPARPLERITVHDVLLAMRAGQGQELATQEGPARSLVLGEYERIEAAERQVACSVNLLHVVNRLARPVEVLPAGTADISSQAAPANVETMKTATSDQPARVEAETWMEAESATPFPAEEQPFVAESVQHTTQPPLREEHGESLSQRPQPAPPKSRASSDFDRQSQQPGQSSQPAGSVGDESFPL